MTIEQKQAALFGFQLGFISATCIYVASHAIWRMAMATLVAVLEGLT